MCWLTLFTSRLSNLFLSSPPSKFPFLWRLFLNCSQFTTCSLPFTWILLFFFPQGHFLSGCHSIPNDSSFPSFFSKISSIIPAPIAIISCWSVQIHLWLYSFVGVFYLFQVTSHKIYRVILLCLELFRYLEYICIE